MRENSYDVEPNWAAFAALDWGAEKHFYCIRAAGEQPCESGELENTPEAIEAWLRKLEKHFGHGPIAVAVEQSRGALVYMLSARPNLVIYTVPPSLSGRYRETFRPSGAKSDASDAEMLLEILALHRDQLRPRRPDTVATRLLQGLCVERRRLVDERTRQTHRLTACLGNYFPQALRWFADVDAPLMAAVLEKWGQLRAMQRSHPGTLRKFFQQHNCRRREVLEQRILEIYAAVPVSDDPAVLEIGMLTARAISCLLQTLNEQIRILEERIEEVTREHPEHKLFSSLPGAGKTLVPRLIAAMGTDRQRFRSAAEVQCYVGIAPVTSSSGKSRWVHLRRSCPKFLRQTFHEYAACSLRKSPWAKAYYRLLREKGYGHHAAVRALAFKWIRIVFRCWKDGQLYDEATYLQSLQRKNSPVVATLEVAALPARVPQWKQIAGFSKLT